MDDPQKRGAYFDDAKTTKTTASGKQVERNGH